MLPVIARSDVFLDRATAVVQNIGLQCETCMMTDIRFKKHVVKHPIIPPEPIAHVQLDCISFTKDVHGKIGCANQIDLFSKFAHSVSTLLV